MGPATCYRYPSRKAVVSGIAIRVEVASESIQEFFWMLPTPSRLVLIQNYGFLCIPTGPVQPHIAVALRRFPRLMKHLQRRLICVKNIPLEQFFMQLLIYGSQVIFCRF